jgi:hypothetical protein
MAARQSTSQSGDGLAGRKTRELHLLYDAAGESVRRWRLNRLLRRINRRQIAIGGLKKLEESDRFPGLTEYWLGGREGNFAGLAGGGVSCSYPPRNTIDGPSRILR